MSDQSPSAVASTSTTFFPPVKRILSTAHLNAFKRSSSHDAIFNFILQLNEAVVDVPLSKAGEPSSRTKPIIQILENVMDIAKSVPPVDNKQSRFGNPAFKTFYDRIGEESRKLHESIPNLPSEAIPELEVYFNESWGNKQRVDYGSGMELNFLCWLYCLFKLSLITTDDFKFLVLGVFWKYILVMRHLQSTYWLEPAGSHGVWGLDDYHFLPFLWGSGQLKDHKHLRPRAIHDPEILEAFSREYMYLACISFINSIKTASLRWHSPMLDDISVVKSWSKVNSGMVKMYDAEVLGKLPVMQHAFFGSLIPFPSDDPQLAEDLAKEGEEPMQPGHEGHVHEKGWSMDCCGIPVPSAFAQSQEILSKPGLRPIPFD